jgi:hypothetical protein
MVWIVFNQTFGTMTATASRPVSDFLLLALPFLALAALSKSLAWGSWRLGAWRGRSQSNPRGVGRRARALNELDEALGLLSPQAAHADRERLSIDSCMQRPQAASRSSSRL